MSLALGVLAPWLVRILAPSSPAFYRADEAVGLLSFASSAYAGYTVLAIGIGRARRTQYNWIVSGVAAALNIALNFALIPPYGMMGAAVATAAAYVTLFAGMAINSQQVYPVPYQWRRVLTLSGLAIVLTVAGYALGLAGARDHPLCRVPAPAAAARLLPAGGACPPQAARAARGLGGVAAATGEHAEATGRSERERETAEHEQWHRHSTAVTGRRLRGEEAIVETPTVESGFVSSLPEFGLEISDIARPLPT